MFLRSLLKVSWFLLVVTASGCQFREPPEVADPIEPPEVADPIEPPEVAEQTKAFLTHLLVPPPPAPLQDGPIRPVIQRRWKTDKRSSLADIAHLLLRQKYTQKYTGPSPKVNRTLPILPSLVWLSHDEDRRKRNRKRSRPIVLMFLLTVPFRRR